MHLRPFFLLAIVAVCAAPLAAQIKPVAGFPIDIVFRPDAGTPLASADSLDVVYAFNYWGTRYGTRLALLENVLRPDSGQQRRAPMKRGNDGWKATIDIPANAAVLSYYFTDGRHREDNGEKTFAAYVYGADGKPVKNAHFYMTSFLLLARADLDTRVKEAEMEIVEWPENFRAYSLYFTLLFERDKGREKSRKQIYEILQKLEDKYRDNDEYLNLTARTLFYVLRETELALKVKGQIAPTKLWPEVFMMYDREGKEEERRRITLEREQRRTALLNAQVPEVSYLDTAMVRRSLRSGKDQAALVVFWATTSEQSMDALRRLSAAWERHRTKNVSLIAVNLDPDEMIARRKMAELALPIEYAFRDGAMVADLGVDAIPTVFFIDPQRVIRKIAVGFSPADEADFAKALQELP